MTSYINGVDVDSIVGGDGVKSGEVDIAAGKLLVGGSAHGGSILDFRNKVTYFTDFLGAATDSSDEPLVTEKEGSGTGNAVTGATSGAGGTVSIKSASDDGAFTANASAIQVGGLCWKASQDNLVMEVALQIDDVSEAYCFVGFTDALPSAGLEQPIYLTSGDAIDSDATDACGLVYDVDATTEQWAVGGVKANTDTDPTFGGSATAPADATKQVLRVEVDSAGAVSGYVDGVLIDTVSAAVTTTTALVPVVVVANRSANAVTALVDYVFLQADRA